MSQQSGKIRLGIAALLGALALAVLCSVRSGASSGVERNALDAGTVNESVLYSFVAAGAKLTQGRRLKTDPPRREVVLGGGPHAGGGASGGDPGFEQTGQEHPGDRADARGFAQHGAALFTWQRTAAL